MVESGSGSEAGHDRNRPVAWVTGASRGMGANIALEFARNGYDLAITARDQQRLDRIAKEASALGADVLALCTDLTDRKTLDTFGDAALARFGRCDVLCNVGVYQGPGGKQLIMDTGLDELAISFEADVIGPVLLCQRAIPAMLAAGSGTIVNMSSSSVVMVPPGTVEGSGWSFAYVAAKAGIDRLASIINVELGDKGIRAFNVEPGFVAYGERFATALRKYPGIPVSPPQAIGPAVLWLVREADAGRLLDKRVNLPGLTHKFGLLAGWNGPGTNFEAEQA